MDKGIQCILGSIFQIILNIIYLALVILVTIFLNGPQMLTSIGQSIVLFISISFNIISIWQSIQNIFALRAYFLNRPLRELKDKYFVSSLIVFPMNTIQNFVFIIISQIYADTKTVRITITFLPILNVLMFLPIILIWRKHMENANPFINLRRRPKKINIKNVRFPKGIPEFIIGTPIIDIENLCETQGEDSESRQLELNRYDSHRKMMPTYHQSDLPDATKLFMKRKVELSHAIQTSLKNQIKINPESILPGQKFDNQQGSIYNRSPEYLVWSIIDHP